MSKKNKHLYGNGGQQQAEELRKEIERLKEESAFKDKRIEELGYYEAELKKERQDPEEIRRELEQSVRADEARIQKDFLEAELHKLEALKKQTEEEGVKVRTDAEEYAQQILEDAHRQADECHVNAEADARVLLESAEKTLSDAKQGETELLESAEREKQSKIAAALEEFETECKTRSADLARREEAVQQGENDAKRERLQLDVQKQDFNWERDELKLQSEALKQRWSQCSPERLAIATAHLEEAHKLVILHQESIAALTAEKERLRRLIPVADGRPAESILRDLSDSLQRIRSLEDQLAAYPSMQEVHSLQKDSDVLASLRGEYHSLARKCSDLEQRALHIELSGRELEQLKIEADALRVLNDELRSELLTHKEALEQKSGERFPELIRIDKTHKPAPARYAAFPAGVGLLQRLAKHVRQYAACRSPHLYYSEQTIRAFIAGLAASKLAILQGLSGTGKTSLPRVFIDAIGGEYATIPVQSSWRDRHELLGYNNDFNKRFSETEFTKAIYLSGFDDQQERVWFVLLDEMNLARVEYYFADFLSVLEEPEQEKWLVPLMDSKPFNQDGASPKYLVDGRKLKVFQNIWFVGTANQDESTFEITDKVYDRAQVIDFRNRQSEFMPDETPEPNYLSVTTLNRAFNAAIQHPSYKLTQAEWSYIETVDECLRERLDLSFGNRIKLQMEKFVPVFVACGGRKEEAVDLQIARKVLRKLVNRFDAGLPDALKELESALSARPSGWQELSNSLEIIERKILKTRGASV